MYVKLFTSIYQGTLRGRPHGLLVFTNLLAHADSHGVVDIHPNAISDEVGLPVDDVRAALLELEAVDTESRSPENDGRRIVRLDGHRAWGWQIVNYVKYRSIKNEDDRREQNREAQARWREKNKQPSADISSVSRGKPMQKQKQKETEIQDSTVTQQTQLDRRTGGRAKEAEDKLQSAFASFWSAYPKKTAKPAALKAFRAQRVNGELPAILGDIERRSSGVDWQKEGGQFVPNPATYLNQRRWEDGNPVNQNQAMAGAV